MADLSVKSVAAVLKVSKRRVHQLIKAGKLVASKPEGFNAYVVRSADLEAFMLKRAASPTGAILGGHVREIQRKVANARIEQAYTEPERHWTPVEDAP